MGVAITFDPTTWLQMYPQFGYLTPAQATMYFTQATMIHRNDGGGPVKDATQQTNLLGLLTAHVAQLLAPAKDGSDPDGSAVGRISQATEGSVSASLELPANLPQAAAWFSQTQYGLMYWTATKPFRAARYLPNNQSPVNAGMWGYGGGPRLG